MKTLITNYSFNAAAHTVTFTGYGSISLASVLIVVNATSNVIIYNFADPAKGGTVATNVLTLTFNTGSMSDSDSLLIYYDDPAVTSNLPTGAATAAKQSDGSQKSQVVDGSGNVIGATSNALDINIKSSGATFTVQAAGDVASASADSGNPVKVGGQARTTNPAAVTDGQRVNAIFDKLGKQISVPAIRVLKGTQHTTITSSTAETTAVAAAGSGVFADVYRLVIANTSATGSSVTIKDATAGTTRYVFWVPANDTRGFSGDAGSATIQSSSNNNWTATCGTSVASIEITADYVQNL